MTAVAEVYSLYVLLSSEGCAGLYGRLCGTVWKAVQKSVWKR
jgi:hypothetical protein